MSAPHEWWEFFFRMPSNTQPSMWLSSLRKVSRTLRQFRSGLGISFGSCLMDLFRGGRAPLAATAGFTVNSYRFSLTVAAALLLPDRSSRLPCAKRTRTFFFFLRSVHYRRVNIMFCLRTSPSFMIRENIGAMTYRLSQRSAAV